MNLILNFGLIKGENIQIYKNVLYILYMYLNVDDP